MLRLLLAAAVMFPGPAAAAAPAAATSPPAFALQETAARASARVHAGNLCAQSPPSCAEANGLREEYLAALSEATSCDAGNCDLEQIGAQARALAELDRREGALPLSPSGRPDRPFLALSAIVSSRLTSAATRLGSPYAAAIYGPDDRTKARKAVEAFCLDARPSCPAMRGLMTSGDELRARLAVCAPAKCTLEQVDPIVEAAKQAMSEYLRLSPLSKADTIGVFSAVNDVNMRGIAAYTPLADQAAADLAKGADQLGAKLDLAEKDAAAPIADVDAAGRDLFERQRLAALAADRLSYYLGYDEKTGALARRAAVNTAAVKLAGLRSRALALRTARGLAGAETGGGAVGAGPSGPNSVKDVLPPVLSTPQRTIIDRRLIPNPAPTAGTAPPIVPGAPSLFQLARNALSSDPALKADALRRLGWTRTVGDPGRYAAVAFSQQDGASCNVAAQAQVLEAHGLLPAGETAASQEKALIAEARRRGYMTNGTPPEYTGSLLVERGMLVVKNTGSDRAALTAAVKRGGLVQIGVDADIFWDQNTGNRAPHSVLITGAELSKADGRILGVYVNDTGTTPPGAGKFMVWSKFLSSWLGQFAEVR